MWTYKDSLAGRYHRGIQVHNGKLAISVRTFCALFARLSWSGSVCVEISKAGPEAFWGTFSSVLTLDSSDIFSTTLLNVCTTSACRGGSGIGSDFFCALPSCTISCRLQNSRSSFQLELTLRCFLVVFWEPLSMQFPVLQIALLFVQERRPVFPQVPQLDF